MANLAAKWLDYCIRGYGLVHLLEQMHDSRTSCIHTIPNVLMKLMAGISIGLPSFNQLESHIRNGYFDGVGGNLRPSADTISRVVDSIPVEHIQRISDQIVTKARYNHALDCTRIHGYRVAAIDGTGLFSTYSARLGGQGHYRKGIHGEDISNPVYLEHAVAVSYVSANGPNLLLDLVRIPSGEGETTTAKRAMESLYTRMCRFCDIVTVDAGYAKAPFINVVINQRKDIVVRVKQDNYNIIKDADGLFQGRPADYTCRDSQLHSGNRIIYDVELWDEEGLVSWENVAAPLRCIKVKEIRRRLDKFQNEVSREHIETHLVTSCPKATVPANVIWEIAHRRWDIENSGFHFMKHHFHLEHAYIYDPQGIDVLLKVFMIAFNLFQLYWHRNLACRVYRKTETMLALMRALMIELALLTKGKMEAMVT